MSKELVDTWDHIWEWRDSINKAVNLSGIRKDKAVVRLYMSNKQFDAIIDTCWSLESFREVINVADVYLLTPDIKAIKVTETTENQCDRCRKFCGAYPHMHWPDNLICYNCVQNLLYILDSK